MDDITIARALHVAPVVFWIGGVAFVTTVLLPAVRRFKAPKERIDFFDQIEQRFAWQARISAAIAGLTEFYMLYRFDLSLSLRSLGFLPVSHLPIGGCTLWWPFGCSSRWCLSSPNRLSCPIGCSR